MSKSSAKESGKNPSFEQRLARLQEIVSLLENGDKPLQESVALYKEGLEQTKACRTMLAEAKHEIEVYSQGVLSPWDESSPDSQE